MPWLMMAWWENEPRHQHQWQWLSFPIWNSSSFLTKTAITQRTGFSMEGLNLRCWRFRRICHSLKKVYNNIPLIKSIFFISRKIKSVSYLRCEEDGYEKERKWYQSINRLKNRCKIHGLSGKLRKVGCMTCTQLFVGSWQHIFQEVLYGFHDIWVLRRHLPANFLDVILIRKYLRTFLSL